MKQHYNNIKQDLVNKTNGIVSTYVITNLINKLTISYITDILYMDVIEYTIKYCNNNKLYMYIRDNKIYIEEL